MKHIGLIVTCDMEAKNVVTWHIVISEIRNVTYNRRQRHGTLPFLKIAMQHSGTPIKGPDNRPKSDTLSGLFHTNSLILGRLTNLQHCREGILDVT